MTRWTPFVSDSLSDLRVAARGLRRQRAFTLPAVGLLSVGMTAVLTVAGALHAALILPLPFPEDERLVMLWSEIPDQEITEQRSSVGNLNDWEAVPSLEAVAAFDPFSATLSGVDAPRRVSGVRASPSFFAVLGVRPLLGRVFDQADVEQLRRVAVISHRLWMSQFGGLPAVLGRRLEIDGRTSEIIGVMPEGFWFPEPAIAFWEPYSLADDWPQPAQARGTDSWFGLARLAHSADIEQAGRELEVISGSLETAYPAANRGLRARPVSLRSQLVGADTERALVLLSAAAVLVLLIVCSNVACLQMARASARIHEISMRMALGAGRWRLIRQVLAESCVLASVAALVALGLSLAAAPAAAAFAGLPPELSEGSRQPELAAAAVFLVLLTLLVFGGAPALRLSGGDALTGLKLGPGVAGRRGDLRTRALLVTVQIALAMVLVVGAGLMLRSASRLLNVDAGFDQQTTLATLRVPGSLQPADRIRFYDEIRSRLQAQPGVEAVGLIEDLFIGGGVETNVAVEGRPFDERLHRISVDAVSPGLFEALGASPIRGRLFREFEGSQTAPVAIINQPLAERFFGRSDPVGRRFRLGDGPGERWLTVIGVVGGMRREGLASQPIPQVFEPLRQRPSRGLNIVVRSSLATARLVPMIRAVVSELDPRVPVYGDTTVSAALAGRHLNRMAQTVLLSLLAGIALLLSAGGIYGVLHYSVLLRRREFAVRSALGAERSHLGRHVLADGIRVALAGMGVGLLVALLTTRWMAGLLFEVAPADPLTVVLVSVVLLATVLLASLGPAVRAARTDPMEMLKSS